ncbi:MAG TPA: FecR domain-containing protein [Polyangiaceae bacterium]|nr:FecR domain-containing protein [Polyangiaceae bacterium]
MTDHDERDRIEEHLAEILDGEAEPELYERLAQDDELRDLRHQAEEVVARVRGAGDDHVSPPDLEARVLAALAARGTSGTAAAVAEPVPVGTSTEPAVDEAVGSPAAPAADSEPVPVGTSTEPAPDAALAAAAASPRAGASGGAGLAPVVNFVSRHRIGLLAGGGLAALGALAAAAAVVLALRAGPLSGGLGGRGWSGTVAHVARAGDRGALELCGRDGGACRPVSAGDAIPVGGVVRTGPTVRAHLTLADGTELSLDRDTRLAFEPGAARRLRLDHGAVVADVAHRRDGPARLDVPGGHVEVLGTKFSLVARPGATAVGVSRGIVELVDEAKRSVRVRAGEEGSLLAGQGPIATATQRLGELLAWSDQALEAPETEVAARGLGELRAKKPTDKSERDAAVTLASHAVKVRISGAVARTEVDEVFRNETGEVLEGIFRFPLPPDAKIERLALEVDGKLEEGAFVDRDRAAAIWRGSIVNAAPELRHEIRDEIVWVPGPWRDPALLEWQRGSRFELRIFPIPARGTRRVVLAYTQLLAPSGSVRRYTYPLAHDPSGSTRVDDFRLDVQVRGHDAELGVAPRGYPLTVSRSGDVAAVTHAERGFVPAGDLVLEYALPDRDREVTAWAYAPGPAPVGGAVASARAGAGATPDPWGGAVPRATAAAGQAALARAEDGYPYVAITLRPRLPRLGDDQARTYAIVVDSSRSMYGESYRRAVRLAARLIRELGETDRFTLLACDTTCRGFPGGVQEPGREASDRVRSWLDGIQPEGASDPTAAIQAARGAASGARGALRVVYVGDGTPTAGPLRPATVADAVRRALPRDVGTVTAVAVGADSDLESLGAMARGGGGVVLPYVPGQSTAEAAFATLGATLGHTLRDVEIELPAGLVARAPERLDTIPAGDEALIVARMTRDEVAGDVVLRGTVGQERFERRYPLRVTASTHPGNSFVPRLYAATRILDLERRADAEARAEAVALSSRFDVASRYTSLLVLESAAMFKAFGLDNRRDAPEWTGEEATADAEGAIAEQEGTATPSGMVGGRDVDDRTLSGGGGTARLATGAQAKSATRAPPRSAPPAPAVARDGAAGERKRARAEAEFDAPPAGARDADAWPGAREESAPPSEPLVIDEVAPPPPPPWGGPREWVPMRRVWERKGEIVTGRTVPLAAGVAKIAEAEREVTDQPNKRGAVRKLYVLYLLAGDLTRAGELAERWSEKEPLDPEALTARADLAAERGDRELAIRVLGSVVDVRPGDVKAQERLARLHRWAGRPDLGCRHAIAVAELHQKDDRLLAAAVECARATGEGPLAELLLGAAAPDTRAAAERRLAAPPAPAGLSGDLQLEATWTGVGHDLDLGLLTPDGHRVSWLGAPTREVITAEDATSERRDALGLRGAAPGEYVIEIVRGRGDGAVSGELTVRVAGAQRKIPFTLSGARTAVAIVRVSQESRLVPVR